MPEVDRACEPFAPRTPMGSHNSIVYAVDDDTRVCEASGELFTSLDLPSVTFGSVRGYVISSARETGLAIVREGSGRRYEFNSKDSAARGESAPAPTDEGPDRREHRRIADALPNHRAQSEFPRESARRSSTTSRSFQRTASRQ